LLPLTPMEVRLLRLGEAILLSLALSLLSLVFKRAWKVGPVLGAAPMLGYMLGYANFLFEVWKRLGRIPLHFLVEPVTLFVLSLGIFVMMRAVYVWVKGESYVEPDPWLQKLFQEAMEQVGVKARLRIVDRGDPVVYARASVIPNVVISVGSLECLGSDELRAVFLHELSHIRLGHMGLKLLYYCTLVLGFLNPLQVKLYRRALREMEREADQLAAELTNGNTLASALTKLAESLNY
jgi:Zn-dependent protease with chaperone function